MAGFIQAVAVDLDGTIAHDDAVNPDILAALDDCRATGTATALVTGRIESELEESFPGLLSHFDVAVLENGAVLSVGGRRTALGRIDPLLAANLHDRVPSIRQGVAILACGLADMPVVLGTIDDLGLDAQLVHNRSELMVLPSGVSKGTGMRAALAEWGVSAHNCIAIGDAENDLSMLSAAEIAVAAPGAVASVVRSADIVLSGATGDGVADFLRGPVVSGAQPVRAARHDLRIGTATDGAAVTIPGAQAGILVCGGSGAGKSHLTGLLVERWIEAGYSVLVIDPEGDHASLSSLHETVVIEASESQSSDGLLSLLGHQSVSVVLDMSRLSRSAAISYLATIAPGVEALRARTGLPHWVVIDEAHGVLGDDTTLASVFRPTSGGYCYVTYHPELLCAAAKTTVDVTLTALAPPSNAGAGGATAAIRATGHTDVYFVPDARTTLHVRHRNKYRDIALPESLQFRFRDSSGRETASAKSVSEFVDRLSSVADDSIVHHAIRGDFSRWAVGAVQDRALGTLLAAIENECTAKLTIAAKGFRLSAERAVAQRYGLDEGGDRPAARREGHSEADPGRAGR